uniref:Proline--tRNA ligase n=1 Tax=Zeugodacus cucurbitae TaxID=28588 RepID=A0A0A1WWA6_ZEUCU
MDEKDPVLTFWTEFTCAYPYSQKMCDGFAKLFRFIFDNHLDSVGTFDTMLLSSFILIFLAFLVASMLTIFEKDQKSLQQIKEKVRHSTAVIAQLAATLWTIRETKFKSITPEGYRRIRENKEAIMALKNPPQTLEMDIPKESHEKPKDVKKKFVRGFKPLKRDLSPPPVKSAPYSILKRAKFVQQKKLGSLSIVQNKRAKNLRAVASAASLNKRQLDPTTPRSISEGVETRNIGLTKVVRKT